MMFAPTAPIAPTMFVGFFIAYGLLSREVEPTKSDDCNERADLFQN